MRSLYRTVVNNWHPNRRPGGEPVTLWTCLLWDVEAHAPDRWVATYLYRARFPIENRVFATAGAAMRAVDAWCRGQWWYH